MSTFRASGNVIFDGRDEAPAELTARIEEALEAALGFEVVTFLRTADEVWAIAAYEPFDRAIVEGSQGKLQVALLSARPASPLRDEVLGMATEEDRLAFAERELYWLPSSGTQKSALDLAAVEKLVGPWTMRTKGTVEQIAARYFAR